mmetsp:Transcript_53172/g.137548  ORF Transcript_53172/g.137548 Transcript_53172/m.137548 type:complete len:485 (-) Transcript_53172:48-1502(-)
MLHAQLVENVGGVHAGVARDLARDDLEGLGVRRHQQLLLAVDRARVLAEVGGELHLDGTAARDHRRVLEQSARVHDSIVQRALGLGDELLGAAAEHHRARRLLLAAAEEVEALTADLLLLEVVARSEHARVQVVARCLDHAAGGLLEAAHVAVLDAAGAEEAAVRKVLRRQVADGELREHNVRSRLDNLVKFLVDDVPLGVDNLLVGGNVGDADLGVVALGLELELHVEQADLRRLEDLGHLLEAGVREAFFEGHALDEHRVLQRAALDLLHTDHLEVGRLGVEGEDSVDHHLREELLVARHQLRVERRRRRLLEHVAPLVRRLRVELHSELVEAADGQLGRLAEGLDDHLRVDPLLNVRLRLPQELARQQHHARRAVADLGVLRHRDLDQRHRRRVDNLQQLHDGRPIIRDGHTALVVVDELVHAARAKRRAHDIDDRLACVDVGDQLRLALARVGALLEEDNLRLHHLGWVHPGGHLLHGCL